MQLLGRTTLGKLPNQKAIDRFGDNIKDAMNQAFSGKSLDILGNIAKSSRKDFINDLLVDVSRSVSSRSAQIISDFKDRAKLLLGGAAEGGFLDNIIGSPDKAKQKIVDILNAVRQSIPGAAGILGEFTLKDFDVETKVKKNTREIDNYAKTVAKLETAFLTAGAAGSILIDRTLKLKRATSKKSFKVNAEKLAQLKD